MKLIFTSLAALFLPLAAPSAATPSASSAASAESAETSFAMVGSDRIAYRSIGQGSPILLLNRMRGTLDTWDPLFLNELAKEHRIVTVDYPGIGYSTGKLPPDMGKAASFALDFATAIGLDRFAVLGWSWGGFVSQTLVADHPDRITHAILVGTNPPGPGQLPIQQVFLDRAFRPVNDLADEEILFFEPRSAVSRTAAKVSRERIYARPNVVDRIPSKPEEIQAFIAAHAQFRDDATGRRAKLTKSRTPILIVCGDNDTSNPAPNWYPLVGQIPNAQIVVYPESGHGPQHQYPELTAAYVATFMRYAPQ